NPGCPSEEWLLSLRSAQRPKIPRDRNTHSSIPPRPPLTSRCRVQLAAHSELPAQSAEGLFSAAWPVQNIPAKPPRLARSSPDAPAQWAAPRHTSPEYVSRARR